MTEKPTLFIVCGGFYREGLSFEAVYDDAEKAEKMREHLTKIGHDGADEFIIIERELNAPPEGLD